MPWDVEAAQLARLQIGDDHYFAPDELLRLVGERDAGHNGARLGLTDVHFEVQQLVGALDGSADFTSPTRRSTFAKSSIEIKFTARRFRLLGAFPSKARLPAPFPLLRVPAFSEWLV